jgi:hypothetical protein
LGMSVTRYAAIGGMVQSDNGDWVLRFDYQELEKAFDEERESNKNTGIADSHERSTLETHCKRALEFLKMYHSTPFPLEVKVCYGDEIDELLKRKL